MILAPLAAAAFNALVILVFAWLCVDGLWRPDGFDYAQIGREILRGHGFGSQQAIYALHLEFLTERDLLTETWPNLHRFPLPSLVLAGWFRLLGEGPVAVVAYGHPPDPPRCRARSARATLTGSLPGNLKSYK